MSEPVADLHLQDIARKAIEAAQLATEAAHEAETAIAARNEAAQALSRTARHTQWLALGAATGAVIVLALGALFWTRASSHLAQAAEVQASATASFIENLMQMNTALDHMQQVIDTSAALADRNEQEVAVLIARLDQRLGDIVQDADRRGDLPQAAQSDPSEVLIALAEVELRLSRQIADLVTSAPPVVPPAPQAAPAPASPIQQPPASRPAPRAASRPAPPAPVNPFSYP